MILFESKKAQAGHGVCEDAPLALDLARLETLQTDEASSFQLAFGNDMIGL